MCILWPCTFTNAAYCSSVLFDKEKGVLKFLRESATLEEVDHSIAITINSIYGDV